MQLLPARAPTPEKGSNPRIFHVGAKLAAMLEELPRNYGDRVFSTSDMPLRHHGDNFRQQRNRIARKLKNPRIGRITFKTSRHWKGTMEYHRTKDILHVQQVLGHKNIQNTLRYITLADELFKGQQEYVSARARDRRVRRRWQNLSETKVSGLTSPVLNPPIILTLQCGGWDLNPRIN